MTDNINMVSLSPSSVPLNQVREKFTKDGFVFPLQIFPDSSFLEKGYADKYKDFRKKCEVERLIPITPTATGDKQCQIKSNVLTLIIITLYISVVCT